MLSYHDFIIKKLKYAINIFESNMDNIKTIMTDDDLFNILINNREKIIDVLSLNYSYEFLFNVFTEINTKKKNFSENYTRQ